MKYKKLGYVTFILMVSLSLTACAPLLIGASAGAAGGYVYSKNAPYSANQ